MRVCRRSDLAEQQPDKAKELLTRFETKTSKGLT
jgi:hypothetical protein